jgi:hypothetical protein
LLTRAVEAFKLHQFARNVREGQDDAIIARIAVGIVERSRIPIRAGDSNSRIGRIVKAVVATAWSSGGGGGSLRCHLFVSGFSLAAARAHGSEPNRTG